MNDVTWVSNVMNDSRFDRDISSNKSEEDIDALIDTLDRNNAGEALPASLFPKMIFPGRQMKGPFKRIPHVFKGGGFWVIDKSVADVLRQFDLGSGALYPVKIFQKDRKTEVAGEYFCINFGNVKGALLLDLSQNLMEGPGIKVGDGIYVPQDYTMPYMPVDDEVALDRSALIGPDIWVDPMLYHAFFISDRLRTALKKAKLDKAFQLYRCRIDESQSSSFGKKP